MAYIENVVIGTPIVDPKDMFVSDEDDWTRMEEEEIMESVSEIGDTNSWDWAS